MNSKNFNAAQKHFEKKRMVLSAQIKDLKEQESKSRKEAEYYKKLFLEQKEEMEEIRGKLKVAMEYASLSEKDLKIALERNKKLNDLYGLLNVFSNVKLIGL